MKTIFTLIILAFSVCSFGQTKSTYAKKFKDADKAFDQAAKDAAVKTDRNLTFENRSHIKGDPLSSDSIGIAHAGFSEASQKIFNDIQTEITELQKQLQEKVKRQDDMFMLLCGAAVPPVDPKRVIKDGIQVKPGELILKYRK